MAEPFATTSDLEARWRPLSTEEQTRAETLLGDASTLIRSLGRGVDERITAGDMDPDTPRAVVCAMVKRAMQGPLDLDGVSQVQQSNGPFQYGLTYANPAGDLYLTKVEKRRLRITAQRAGSVDMLGIPTEG